jgi:hypothetical protein
MVRKIDGNDGCKFINIKNCNITMTKGTGAYVTGIYVSNLDAASPVNANTGILVQSTAGRNESITITGNTIGNVVTGIHLRGFNDPAAGFAFYDQNMTVGGTTGNGNIIRNFGGGSTSTAYGIYSQYNSNFNYSYNTFNNADGGGTNATGTLYCIYNPSSGALSGGTVYINNNTFQLGMSSASAMYPIYNVQSCSSVEISGNTFGFSNTFASTTVYLIYNSNATTNNTISYNSTTGTISKTGSGTFYGYYNFGSAVNGLSTISNNNFSNITLTGTSAFIGIQSATSATHTQDIYSNIISNVTAGSGTSYGIYCYYGLLNNIYLNQVNMLSGGGTLYGIYSGGTSSVTCYTHDNTINNLSTTGSSSGIHGIYATVAPTNSIYNNKIYNISAGGTTGSAAGITGISGTTLTFYNNYISDIKAPNSSGANVVNGINITGGTTANVFYNTIFLNATGTGATFGSSAVYAASTVGLDLRNNILVNKSTRNGNTGFTVGLRRNAAYNATYYLAGSNTNDIYVPTTNWNYHFFDGVAGTAGRDSTISMFKTRVAPRDAGSFSEDPPFVNATTAPYDLHLQTILPSAKAGLPLFQHRWPLPPTLTVSRASPTRVTPKT